MTDIADGSVEATLARLNRDPDYVTPGALFNPKDFSALRRLADDRGLTALKERIDELLSIGERTVYRQHIKAEKKYARRNTRQ
jgi:hypothetical protein